jgi:SAM-dependent methyltransferase
MNSFNQSPKSIIQATNRPVYNFHTDTASGNIDLSVVNSFGEEWSKFSDFSDAEIDRLGRMYFDILDDTIINANTYAMDVGCGTGRWTKYLLNKIGFMEAIDPSDAIFVADKLLSGHTNVRLSKASTDGMSIGVLHHIPDTQKAMSDCVKKVKIGGHFYTYLYYDLENRGPVFKMLLSLVTGLRQIVSSLPTGPKKFVCDVIAILIYMPLVLAGRLLKSLGFRSLARKLPLDSYQDQTFFVIRNDALDRFGTSLEQRFSRAQITSMMQNAGLTDIRIADTLPFWHAVGRRIR